LTALGPPQQSFPGNVLWLSLLLGGRHVVKFLLAHRSFLDRAAPFSVPTFCPRRLADNAGFLLGLGFRGHLFLLFDGGSNGSVAERFDKSASAEDGY
jgi:hypothetical protein